VQREAVFHKAGEIVKPSPSQAFVLIHTTPQTTGDGEAYLPITPWRWGAYPFNHEKGQNWSFADGHVDHPRWVEEDTVTKSQRLTGPADALPGNRDYLALQMATPMWWVFNPADPD
jgi:prepilin-type processing-associated H-X9-DG protein